MFLIECLRKWSFPMDQKLDFGVGMSNCWAMTLQH
uniref:Uncharacterized protein n=1 Tax=Arundo donax TaxID=35708 RepID=A0A0A9FVU6_ARUDO